MKTKIENEEMSPNTGTPAFNASGDRLSSVLEEETKAQSEKFDRLWKIVEQIYYSNLHHIRHLVTETPSHPECPKCHLLKFMADFGLTF